jgi:hypothetical protein
LAVNFFFFFLLLLYVAFYQGDHIWRIFAHCAGAFFGQFFRIHFTKVAHIFGLLYYTVKVLIYLIKITWATFWAIFSKTHQVTLPSFFFPKVKSGHSLNSLSTSETKQKVFQFVSVPFFAVCIKVHIHW